MYWYISLLITEGDGTESVSQPLDEVRFKPEGGKTIDQIPSQDSMADQKLQEVISYLTFASVYSVESNCYIRWLKCMEN